MANNEVLWSQSGIEYDTVARRRSNTCTEVANITAAELKSSPSIESLMRLNVPVYRYKTQVTIHGVLPETEFKNVTGYQCIVQNGNGTIGLKYVGIDGEKKVIIRKVASVVKSDWCSVLDSRGLVIWRDFDNPADCKTCYETLSADHFYGRAQGYKFYPMWRDIPKYRVELSVDAIPADSLWSFIGMVYGVDEQGYLAAVEAENERKRLRELEYAEREAENKKLRELQRVAALEAVKGMQEYASSLPNRKAEKLPESGEWLVVYQKIGEPITLKRLIVKPRKYALMHIGSSEKPKFRDDYNGYVKSKFNNGLILHP